MAKKDLLVAQANLGLVIICRGSGMGGFCFCHIEINQIPLWGSVEFTTSFPGSFPLVGGTRKGPGNEVVEFTLNIPFNNIFPEAFRF